MWGSEGDSSDTFDPQAPWAKKEQEEGGTGEHAACPERLRHRVRREPASPMTRLEETLHPSVLGFVPGSKVRPS